MKVERNSTSITTARYVCVKCGVKGQEEDQAKRHAKETGHTVEYVLQTTRETYYYQKLE